MRTSMRQCTHGVDVLGLLGRDVPGLCTHPSKSLVKLKQDLFGSTVIGREQST